MNVVEKLFPLFVVQNAVVRVHDARETDMPRGLVGEQVLIRTH